MAYSFLTGIVKSIKNVVVVLTPAFLAGYAAFYAALPPEYQTPISVLAAFLAYFVKNWYSNRDK